MIISNIKATLPYDVKEVWDIVTSLEDYAWRSDLSKIEVLSEVKFVEYTKDGFPTTFTITVMEPYQGWEFDIENENMNGHWTGLFTKEGNITRIDFTENINAKKALLKPFIRMYLKKQQKSYVRDLKRALRKRRV